MNLSFRYAVSEASLTSVITNWTTAEHARLHGPGNSVLTDLEAMRQTSALPFNDSGNIGIAKTRQHLDRLKHRLGNLESAAFEEDFTGRAVSDCLKLFAGQQIKRLVAQSRDQDNFAQRVRSADLGVDFTVTSMVDALPHNLGTLDEEIALLGTGLESSLQTITERAAVGSDWGLSDSVMVEAAWLGEVACARITTVAVGYIALQNGGIDKVPLRVPASDAEKVALEYPFTWEG